MTEIKGIRQQIESIKLNDVKTIGELIDLLVRHKTNSAVDMRDWDKNPEISYRY